jgi:YesN/AraC family two-component response regulator
LSRSYPLLWVDATVSRNDMGATADFEGNFEIHRYAGLVSLDSEIASIKPAVVCFEFDFPTKVGLKLLQRTKQAHPRIPLLMLTVQHSESLAVWAFRSKVWDYLVKPVARAEIERCIVGLHEMLQMQALQKETRSIASIKALIPEENRANGIRGHAALQLAYAIEFVEKNFREKISSGDVAQQCSLTPFQFSRMFKETYGLTFQEYILRYRIREACRLLKNPTAEIAEVASLTGFNDPSYFGKIFRRYMSCSPSQYQTANDAPLDSGLLEDLLGHSAQTER